ncbi:TadE family protein [Nocardioides yefusunii]|uniref:TadE family type IV pilus minor pilin n=1 Tax=Nocardioides yefusunii TaxID=2500546 RepID=A0ABW1QWJ6_9ACTN|nr:TadE family protein [Nocardioides yefusunii]
MGKHARGERGAVTAEAAMVMPLLAAVTVGLVWCVAVGASQLRTVDAAREAARVLARGEDEATAVTLAERIAPDGARVEIGAEGGDEGGYVRVTVSADVAPPGGVFSTGAVTVSSTSVAAREETNPW